MIMAKIYPEPAKLKRKDVLSQYNSAVSKQRLSYARTVLEFAPELVNGVICTGQPYRTPTRSRRRGIPDGCGSDD